MLTWINEFVNECTHIHARTPPPRAFHATRAKHPPWTCTRHRGLLDTALGCSPVCPSSKSWDAGFCLEFCCILPALPLQEWKPFTQISYAMKWYYQFWAYFSQVNLINILILKYYIRTRQSRYKIIVKVVLTSKKIKVSFSSVSQFLHYSLVYFVHGWESSRSPKPSSLSKAINWSGLLSLGGENKQRHRM